MVLFNAMCFRPDGSAESIRSSRERGRPYRGDDKTICYEAFFQSDRLNTLRTKAMRRDRVDVSVDYSPWGRLSLGEERFLSLPMFDRAESVYYPDQSLYRCYTCEDSIATGEKPRCYETSKMLWAREDEYFASWHIREEAAAVCWRASCNRIVRYAVDIAGRHSFQAFRRETDRIRQGSCFFRAMERAHLSGWRSLFGRWLRHDDTRLLYLSMRIEYTLTRSGA